VRISTVHELFGIAVDLIVGEDRREAGAGCVHRPREEVHLAVDGYDEALRHVERPRVVAGEIEEVRRVGHHQRRE